MINIREVHVDDVPAIVQMLRVLRLESPEYNYADDDPEYVTPQLEHMIRYNMMHGVVAVAGDTLVGFMIGFIAAPWYSKRVEALEQLLYVDETVRGGTTAVRLIKTFEVVCKDHGAAVLQVGASTGMQEDRTVRLYERMGYTKGSPTLRKVL